MKLTLMSTANVYIVHHVRKTSEEEDIKLIGVYSTASRAQGAVDRLRSAEGFKSHPDGFTVSPYVLDQDHWTEGFLID